MSIKLTDEQLMIQTMVRDFSREVIAPTAAERDKTKEFPGDNLKQLGELGFMGMMVPPEYNGSGADTISYVLALSEVAYSCASTAVVMSVHNSIVCESILRYGSEDQKQRFLKPLATGEVIGAFALSNNMVIIALGLSIGAMFVRSMTIHLVRKGTLKVSNVMICG